MRHRHALAAAGVAAIAFTCSAFAQQYGSRDGAKAMLLKAVAAIKADKAKALAMINKGEGGFLDRDLYPFCFDAASGRILALANPNAKSLLGQDERTLTDATGKPFGQEVFAAAQKPEGEISEVNYMFPKPGSDSTPVAKESFVTRVDGLGCGSGFYK